MAYPIKMPRVMFDALRAGDDLKKVLELWPYEWPASVEYSAEWPSFASIKASIPAGWTPNHSNGTKPAAPASASKWSPGLAKEVGGSPRKIAEKPLVKRILDMAEILEFPGTFTPNELNEFDMLMNALDTLAASARSAYQLLKPQHSAMVQRAKLEEANAELEEINQTQAAHIAELVAALAKSGNSDKIPAELRPEGAEVVSIAQTGKGGKKGKAETN